MSAPVSDKELAAAIKTELSQSGNWAGSEHREAIKQSLNYFLLRAKGDEVPGRSQIQSGDVADMIDHVHAEMQPMYAVDELCEIGEEGPGDEETAQAETAAVNWYWRERLRGFEVLDDAVQDGLAMRNGYIKVWYEESYGLPYEETIEGDELQINASLAQLGENNRVEILEYTETQAATTVDLNPYSDILRPISGSLVVMPALYSVKLKITPLLKEVKGQSVAPEDMLISKDATSSNLQMPRFVAQRRLMARQDVKALGLDQKQVDRIPQHSSFDTDVRQARKTDYNTFARYAAHQSGQQVELYEVYYRIDRDGDGIPELWKIFYADIGELLRWEGEGDEPGEVATEMVRARPFASGSPLKVAHRHEGRSVWDKEKQIEDFGRELMRQMLDNLHIANDTTLGVSRNVSEEDIQETDVGRIIVCDNPQTDLRDFKHNNIVVDSLAGLQYKDKMRRERVSSAIDTSGENMPVTGPAHSTERIMSAMERVVGMFARNFAETLARDTFVLLHQQLKLLPGRVAFKSDNQWQETQPRFWIDRTRISVKMAPSEGEKMRKGQALREVIAIQREDGGAVLSPEEYESRMDFSRMMGLENVQQYWLDPESERGQQEAQAQQEAAQQQAQMAAQQQQMLLAAQMQVVRMQEETKRAAEQIRSLNDQQDRLADMMQKAEDRKAKYTELELKYGTDVPDEGMERLPAA